MEFTVSTRTKDGGIAEEVFEAASREELFGVLASRGIKALSVREGAVRGKPKRPRAVAPRGAKRGLLAGAIVVAGALAALWLLSPSGAEPDGKPAGPRAPRAAPPVAPAKQAAAPEEASAETPDERAKRERKEMLEAMAPDERREFIRNEMLEKPLDLTPSSNRVFKTGTEQVLSWIFTTDVGDMPPPLPKISIRDEAHIMEILDNHVAADEGDSERVKDAKDTVALAKEELRRFVDGGGKVQDFLEYWRGKLVLAHQERMECQRQVIAVAREEPEIALEYLEEINRRLDEKGIKRVKLPDKLMEKLTK